MAVLTRENRKRLLRDLLGLAAGGALFGLSMNLFFLPGGVVTGGITGISTALELLFGIPAGVMIPLLNLPLLAAAFFVFGFGFVVRSAVGIAASSLFTLLLGFLPASVDDPLLCALLGGVGMGAGCGMMFSRGFTTGGSDIAAWFLRRRFPSVGTGRLILFVDALIILASAAVLGRYEGIFYSAVALFFFSVTVDMVMRNGDRGSLAFIFTPESRTVALHISEKLGRGVTLIRGRGWYSGEEGDILLCAVRRRETGELKALVLSDDPDAFTVFADTSLTMGEGFRGPG